MKNISKEHVIFLFGIFILVLGIILFFYQKKDLLSVHILSSNNEQTGCKTIYANSEMEISEYSFDNGSSWKKSNYEVVCSSGVKKVLGRNASNKIIAKGTIEINDLHKNSPKIEIDFDTEINALNENALLNGVKATSTDGKDITDRIIVETKTSDDNKNIIIKYSVFDDYSNKTVVERNLSINLTDTGKYLNVYPISYDKQNYSCETGKNITATISVGFSGLIPSDGIEMLDNSYVESYKSSNTSIATIKKHPTLSSKNKNSEIVLISCLKTGDVVLSALSSVGSTTTSNISVAKKQETEKLTFEKNSYEVSYGKTITIKLHSTNKNDLDLIIKDPSIISASKITFVNNTEATIKIKGLKVGTTSIEVSDKNGEKTSAIITVKDCIMEFGSNNYQLSTGVRTMGTIKSSYITGEVCDIKSIESSNTSIVSILYGDENSNAISSNNNFKFYMNPIKEGIVTLTAICETGKKITSNVTVKNKKVVQFTNSNYELNVGNNLYVTIASFLENGEKDEIVKIQVENTDILAAKLNGYNTEYNRYGITLTGTKAGTTIITATTKSGTSASAKVVVSDNDKGSISFDKLSYTCSVGQKITTQIIANHSKITPTVKSYKSSDTSIATIIKHPTLTSKYPNATMVQINCLKNGSVTLSATSSLGAISTSKLTSNNNIYFEKNSYNIDVGKTIDIKLMNVKNKDITVIPKDKTIISTDNFISYSNDNKDEGYISVKGLKVGTTILSVTDKEGNTLTTTINVKDCNMNFESTNYNLLEGESLLATITSKYSDGKDCNIKSITSSNTSVATINYDNKNLYSSSKYSFYINAKKKGETILSATCETGKKITAKVKVETKLVQNTSLIKDNDFLITNGTKIVKKGTGEQVVLRGYNIGQWLSRGIHALPIAATYNSLKTIAEGGTRYSDNNDIEIDYEMFTNINNFTYDEVITLNNAFYNNYISENDAKLISETGSNAVRIAIGYSFFMKPIFKNNELTYILDNNYMQERLDLLEEKVNMFAKYGIYSILDMHLGPGNSMSGGYRETIGFFYGDSEHSASYYQQIALDIWKYIAIRFKNHPAIAGYDIINEPSADFLSKVLPYYEKAYNVIRSQDKNHIIIMQARFNFYYNWERGWLLPKPEEKGWKNVVYSIHEYHLDNGEYNLCGSNPRWCKLEDYYKRIAKGDYQDVDVYIDRLKYTSDISLKNMKEYNVPLYVGEFNLADLASETDYVWGYMMDIYNTNNISYTAWTYKTGWEAYDGLVYYGRKGFVSNSQKGKVDLKKATYTDIMNVFNPCSIPTLKNEYGSSSNAIMNFNTRFYNIFKKHTQTIVLSTNTLNLDVGSSAQISATIKPSGAKYTKITWSSDNPQVAQVDSTGKITAISQGKAIITAKTQNGTINTCTVVCEEPVSINAKRIGPFNDDLLFSKIKEQLQIKNINYKSNDKNKFIDISNNDISKITKLDLSSQTNSTKKISDLKGISTLSNLTSLTSLNLSNNNLEYNDIEEIGKLTNLIELNLGSNNIGKTIPGALGNLINLKALYLSNNKITKLTTTSAISKLKKLNTLTMKNNQIEDASALNNLTNLQNNSTTTNFQQQKIVMSTTSSTINLPNIFLNEKIGSNKHITAFNTLEIEGNATLSSDKTKVIINQKGSGIIKITLKGGIFDNSILTINYNIE